jgi:hypothetical protein
VEVSDQEWEAEMQEDFENSGLLHTRGKRGILSKVPKGNLAFKICMLLLAQFPFAQNDDTDIEAGLF